MVVAAVALLVAAIGMFAVSRADASLVQTFNADPAVLPAAIPDPEPFGSCNVQNDDELVVPIPVSGVSGGFDDIAVSLDIAHTYLGDVSVRLVAPDGVTSHLLFSHTGSTSAATCGLGADLDGIYGFSDRATDEPNGGWWQAAATVLSPDAMPEAVYRTVAPGGEGAVSPAPPTLMTPVFRNLPDLNGAWTLRVRDSGGGDVGTVRGVSLTFTTDFSARLGKVKVNRKQGNAKVSLVTDGTATVIVFGNGIRTVYRQVKGKGRTTSFAVKPIGALRKKLKKKGKAKVKVTALMVPAADVPLVKVTKKITLKAKKAKKKKSKKKKK